MATSVPDVPGLPDLPDLDGASALPDLPDLDGAPAEEVLRWALGAFFPDITVACSMQDVVVVDLAWQIEPQIEVFFLETGFHFPETLETADRLRERYSLRLVALTPAPGPAVYSSDGVEACCHDRKVRPMERHLAGKRAWVTGLRRAESPTRAGARPVEWDAGRGLVKVNPIVDWSDDDVERYCAEHDIVRNPLRERGYASIGCWPCTVPGKGREGRWSSSDKLECGLHAARPAARPAGEVKPTDPPRAGGNGRAAGPAGDVQAVRSPTKATPSRPAGEAPSAGPAGEAKPTDAARAGGDAGAAGPAGEAPSPGPDAGAPPPRPRAEARG